MGVYLTTTVSPAMLSPEGRPNMTITELAKPEFAELVAAKRDLIIPAVGHQNTATILESKFGLNSLFAQVSPLLRDGDTILVAIPLFRADAIRELSTAEIRSARFRYFVATVGLGKGAA
ncbi:MAG: hypothetical protein ABIL58_23440 [Pseudomonadota bacterium]